MASVHPTMGKKLQWFREQRDLSVRGLAEKANVSPSLVSKVERGKATLGYERCQRLAQALGIPPEWLWDHGPIPQLPK